MAVPRRPQRRTTTRPFRNHIKEAARGPISRTAPDPAAALRWAQAAETSRGHPQALRPALEQVPVAERPVAVTAAVAQAVEVRAAARVESPSPAAVRDGMEELAAGRFR